MTALFSDLSRAVAAFPDYHFIFAGLSNWKSHLRQPSAQLVSENVSFTFLPPGSDLVSLFQQAHPNLVIFHGGGNTFSEALSFDIPMIVCPFFGDQFETARQAGYLYSGNFVVDIKCALFNTISVRSNNSLVTCPFDDTIRDYFVKGDLLFGHWRHRNAMQANFVDLKFHLGFFAPFYTFANPELGDLPAIADVYNDDQRNFPLELPHSCDYYKRLQRVKQVCDRQKQSIDLVNGRALDMEEYYLVHYCLEILELTVNEWKNKIHFVIDDESELGSATIIELNYIKKHWTRLSDSIIFYNSSGKRIPAPPSVIARPKKDRNVPLDDQALSFSRDHLDQFCILMPEPKSINPLCGLPERLVNIPGRMPLVMGRRKSRESVKEKMELRGLPVYDKIAYRMGYLNQSDLNVLINHIGE